jgi:Fur family ferric uptake transcriptional regulator
LSAHVERVRDEMRAGLRERGLRATAPRIAVLVVLHEAEGPLTHEQVMEVLPGGAFDKATVWRVLADLADCGMLRRMDLGDRVWRYELRDACRAISEEHPHFMCEACGEVRCLPPLFVRAADGSVPVVLRGAELQVRVTGRCAGCVTA